MVDLFITVYIYIYIYVTLLYGWYTGAVGPRVRSSRCILISYPGTGVQ